MTVLELEAIARLHHLKIRKWPERLKGPLLEIANTIRENALREGREEQKALEANRALARIDMELNQ